MRVGPAMLIGRELLEDEIELPDEEVQLDEKDILLAMLLSGSSEDLRVFCFGAGVWFNPDESRSDEKNPECASS